MKSVARSHGLKVNKYVDERKDFDKSAKGASLISNTCIPEAVRILSKNDIEYCEDDLKLKLFVLHIYHAGAGNVSGLLGSIDASKEEWSSFKRCGNPSGVGLKMLHKIIHRWLWRQ